MRPMSTPDSITDLMASADVVVVDDDLKDTYRLAKRLSSELAQAQAGTALAVLLAPLHGALDAPGDRARRMRVFLSTLDDPSIDQAETYIERLMPDEVKLPEPAVLTQLYRNVRLRVHFLEHHESWDATQVAEFSGSSAKNKAATAARWRAENRIFAVTHRAELLYPAFQFDVETRRPKDVMAPLLAMFAAHDASGWQIALWLTRRHPQLGQAPLALVDDQPDRVMGALAATYAVAV